MTQQSLAALKKQLRRRSAIEQQGYNPPQALRLDQLAKHYGITVDRIMREIRGMK